MLQRLKEGKIESLRQLIYDAGREYPRQELVTEVLRPLRSQVSANVPAIMTLREILDGIIIAYTSFCLEGDKKAPGDNFLITGWHLTDACEIWLEALKRTGQGHRIDVLPVPPAALAPEIFPQRNWLLVTSGKLSAARQRQVELWQQQVVSLEVIRSNPLFSLTSTLCSASTRWRGGLTLALCATRDFHSLKHQS